jgi:hypothetical protein
MSFRLCRYARTPGTSVSMAGRHSTFVSWLDLGGSDAPIGPFRLGIAPFCDARLVLLIAAAICLRICALVGLRRAGRSFAQSSQFLWRLASHCRRVSAQSIPAPLSHRRTVALVVLAMTAPSSSEASSPRRAIARTYPCLWLVAGPRFPMKQNVSRYFHAATHPPSRRHPRRNARNHCK